MSQRSPVPSRTSIAATRRRLGLSRRPGAANANQPVARARRGYQKLGLDVSFNVIYGASRAAAIGSSPANLARAVAFLRRHGSQRMSHVEAIARSTSHGFGPPSLARTMAQSPRAAWSLVWPPPRCRVIQSCSRRSQVWSAGHCRWLPASCRSLLAQADTERADLARERRELAETPDTERAELAGIYAARGLTPQSGDSGRQPVDGEGCARRACARRAGHVRVHPSSSRAGGVRVGRGLLKWRASASCRSSRLDFRCRGLSKPSPSSRSSCSPCSGLWRHISAGRRGRAGLSESPSGALPPWHARQR